jgi:hypothetical protein
MRKGFIFVSFLVTLLPATLRVKAQTADTGLHISMAYVDSVMNNDTLLKDLSAFIDSAQGAKTLFAVELGVGNGFFVSRNATAATGYVTQPFFSPTVTYLHKSGLGISASAYATQNQGRLMVYQGAITPSFGINRKSWSAGISYSRYISKDSVSFGLDPLRNDTYIYGIFRKFWLEPGVAFDYSFDSYKQDQYPVLNDLSRNIPDNSGEPDNPGNSAIPGNAVPGNPAYDYKVHAHTMSAIATLQHDFEWFSLFTKNDHIAFTPTVNLLADASNYDISTVNHLKTGMPMRWGPNDNKTGKSTGFALESTGALLDAVYTYGHFLVDPQILATYFINASPGVQSFRVSYLVNVGLVF